MFPTNWCQLFIDIPETNTGPQYPYKTSLHWFSYFPTPDPLTYDRVGAALALLHWAQAGVVGMATNEPGHLRLLSGWFYMSFPGHVYTVGVAGGTFRPPEPLLPQSQNVIIRRYTGMPGRRREGRIFMSPVAKSMVQDDALTLASHAEWQGHADTMVSTPTYGGVNFTPCLVSYADSALVPITRYEVMQRLGRVKRRQRKRITLPPPSFSYKPPPP